MYTVDMPGCTDCCPQSGTTTCCTDPIPFALKCTISSNIFAACACLDAVVIPLTWDGTIWTGTVAACGHTLQMDLRCNGFAWEWRLSCAAMPVYQDVTAHGGIVLCPEVNAGIFDINGSYGMPPISCCTSAPPPPFIDLHVEPA